MLDSTTQDSPDTLGALRRLGMALGTAVALMAFTYVIPGLERVRPWVPSDGAPLAQVFQGWREVPTFAGAGGAYRAPEQVSRRVEEELGSAVAANLGEAAGVRRGQTQPAPEGDEGGAAPAVRIDPGEYEGIEVEIENASALSDFFEALEKTARRQDGNVTRIAHYGDSSIATDLITHTVRRRLQRRFGDAGHGFVLIARGSMPWGHRDVQHRSSEAWELEQIVNDEDSDGHYGYGGVAFEPLAHTAWAKFATDDRGPVGGSVSRYIVHYQRQPRGGAVRYRVDGGDWRSFDTEGGNLLKGYVVDVPDGAHELEIRPGGGGKVRLYGVAMERQRPGVVYDSLGLVGARARRLLNYDPQHIRQAMSLRNPDLLVLGFGGNEADDPIQRMPRYEPEFRQVIRRMKAGRSNMACLVFAPLDQAHRNERGRVETIPTVPLIVEAQKAAARAEGCAFYNNWEAMGGEGAMRAWTQARPRLATTDYRHATPAGYEVIGNMFYKALLKAFADHL